MAVRVCSVLFLFAVFSALAASCPQANPAGFYVYIQNESADAVRVDAARSGVRWRLATIEPGRTAAVRASCATYTGDRVDFVVRSIGAPFTSYVHGEHLSACSDSLTVYVPRSGARWATVHVR